MADKFMSGIGRELRYMEYKLRKKHSDWDKDRKKTKQNQNDKKVPSMKEFTSDQVSPDLANALPTDNKEEALQIQVALAISKEEMNEAQRQEESDRVRLELALKQSEAAMAEAEAKIKMKQQQGSAPSTSNDPWGSTNVSAGGEAQQSAFDPFSGAGPSTSNVKTSDPWENATLAKPPTVSAPTADPWSQATPSASKSRTDSFSDLFGGSTSAPPQQQSDPWGSSVAPKESNKFDPFQPSSAPAGTDPVFSTAAAPVISQTPSFDSFAPSATTSQAFDPLSEFDDLHLGNFNGTAQTAAPSLTTMPVAMEPFVLEPLPVNSQPISSNPEPQTADSGKMGNFLEGNMSSLIDMNSLLPSKAPTNPYTMTKTSASTTSNPRNPFMLKPPAPSLNQLQNNTQGGSMFGDAGQEFAGLMQAPTGLATSTVPQQNFFGQQMNLSAGSASSVNPFPTAQNPF